MTAALFHNTQFISILLISEKPTKQYTIHNTILVKAGKVIKVHVKFNMLYF